MSTTVKILIVTDADGAFDQKTPQRFGLTVLLDALRSNVQDGMDYKITTAHRYPKSTYPQAASADLDHFVFDSKFTTANYDELWLFGIASSNPSGPYGDPQGFALQPQELQIIQTFMEQGGGVFATGDHDDLGRDLCGSIPRVRNMRRWNFDYVKAGKDYQGYDENSDDSPPVKGPHRHSTINVASNGRYEFDNQSDDIPQKIDPVWTTIITGPKIAEIITHYPHPLLCGIDGVIDVLPDHMHEGQVEIPAKLDLTYSSHGANVREYPDYFGSPLSPQVVAFENIVGRKVSGPPDPGAAGGYDDNEPLESDQPGCIAAWDGQLVSNGRVVVGSTFHHFVDVNFLGVGIDKTHNWAADETAKTLGLANSITPEGQAAYKRIRQYFRNIARWLAPASKQTAFKIGWIRRASFDPRISKTIGLAHGIEGILRFGGGMRSLMLHFLPPCAVTEVSSIGSPDPLSILLGHWYILLTLPDPPPELNPERLGINLGVVSQFILGAAGAEANRAIRRTPNIPDAELLGLVQKAVRASVPQFLEAQLAGQRNATALTEHLIKAVGASRH